MIAVIFEVTPGDGQMDAYLDHAAALRSKLDTVPGFISVERFQSLSNPGKLLSLSFFESEEALTRWRNQDDHRATQEIGRARIFSDYRLRVAAVLRDYGMNQRLEAPEDSRRIFG